MFLKLILIFLGAVAAGTSVRAQDKPASALDNARDQWHLCIANEAVKLDDGVSPASDIASAVQSSCETEFSGMLDRMTLNPEMRQLFMSKRLESTKEVGITIALKLRAKKRAAESNTK